MAQKSIDSMVEILYHLDLRTVVICPGSRSAPLTQAFAKHSGFRKFVIPDERSAGYMALGMAQVTGKPTILVSTSGTAAINFFPAVAESYFQQVPLLVLTADRPPEWIDQDDGQTVHQDSLYGTHVKASYIYPQEDNIQDVKWHRERMISEAIRVAMDFSPGPVHINFPFREPLYPAQGATKGPIHSPRIIRKPFSEPGISGSTWDELARVWADSEKILVVGGQQRLDTEFTSLLQSFSDKFGVPVAGDSLSNLHGMGKNLITLLDPILWDLNSGYAGSLKPDLLISFGKSVISKSLKLFLRHYQPEKHWHIQPGGYLADPFQSVTDHIPLSPLRFFNEALDKFKPSQNGKNYLITWTNHEKVADEKLNQFFPAESFSELEATHLVMRHLPDKINLHLANSMPVRLVSFQGKIKKGIEVFSNRGTSGIDGCVSTAVGSSIQSECMNVLISGDMAFFYDRNAFWHMHNPENLRIILLNNHGGGIFRMIEGPSRFPEFEKYFESWQPLTAENLAAEYGFDYTACFDRKSLKTALQSFFSPGKIIKILEIQTDSKTNKTIFDQFKSQFC